jgi:hypothetical protein
MSAPGSPQRRLTPAVLRWGRMGLRSPFRRAKAQAAAACGSCGYSTAGLPTPTCPECGSDIREAAAATQARCPVPRLARRLGLAAFLFFFIKGLLWLLIPAALATGWISFK